MHRWLNWSTKMERFFPFLTWLPELKHWPTLRADLIAGLSVAMLLIPQSMAYAQLAGLPAYYGLYAAFLPPIIAALFGSARTLSTGPVAMASLLTAAALQPIAASGTTEYIQYVFLLTLIAGIIQFTLGILRLGVVINFLSYPVILGFTNAAAIIIASAQLSSLFGIKILASEHHYQTVWHVLKNVPSDIHWPTVIVASIALIIMLVGRRFWPRWPHVLIAVVVTTLIAWLSGYEKSQVINVSKIINLPIQRMIMSHQNYPKEMELLLNNVAQAKQTLKETIRTAGKKTDETAEAMNNLSHAKWLLERRIIRHKLESTELNQIHLQSLITENGKTVYFTTDQMTPIGDIGPNTWRINNISSDGGIIIEAGGDVVGNIPRGLPDFRWVSFSWDGLQRLFMSALVIALIGFMEAVTIAKYVATDTRQRLNINQELLGQGLAKFVGSFFQSMPVSGGFSRSAVNFNAGAKTGFSSIFAGFVVMIVLLWLTSLFYYLPDATLAAVVIVAVLGLLNFKAMWRTWRINRNEGFVVWFTFLLTLALAPRLEYAILLGMLLSLGVYLQETMSPRFTELTRDSDGELGEVTAQTDETCYLISLIRFGGSLYFANVSYFEDKIVQLIAAKPKLRYIILDCISINKIDASGLETLSSICDRLEDAGMELWFTRVRQPVLNVLKKGGLFDKLGQHNFYKSNELALEKLTEYLGAKHMNTCPLAMPSN